MRKKVALILICLILYNIISCNISIFGSKLKNEVNLKLTAKDKLQKKDFTIGGIYINQPINEVIKILGKPQKIQKIPNGFQGSDEYDYYFPGVIIITSGLEKKVFQLKIENGDIKTFRGIAVGDKEQDVYYRYGKKEKLDNKILRYQMFVDYQRDDSQNILDFYIQNNKVTKIMIYIYSPE